MKISKEKLVFQPVTITLETLDEVNGLWTIVTESIPGTLSNELRAFRTAILNELEKIPSYS